jgi:hypothetical protein
MDKQIFALMIQHKEICSAWSVPEGVGLVRPAAACG